MTGDRTAADVVRDLPRRREIEYDESRPTASSRSRCRGSTSCRPPCGSTSARTRSACTPSCAAAPTRTTRRLPLAARAQPADVRRRVRPRPPRRHLPRRPAAAVAVTPDELDRLLGSVLTYADESFNTLLELGFASSIRKEWEWRKLRGESTRNLEAFRGWLEAGAEPDSARLAGPAWPCHAAPHDSVSGLRAAPGRRSAACAGDGDADQGERAADVRHRRAAPRRGTPAHHDRDRRDEVGRHAQVAGVMVRRA